MRKTDVTAEARRRLERLRRGLRKMGGVLVAFSGGTDSSFLLRVAVDELGAKRVAAVSGDSETYTRSELRRAGGVARELGVRHRVIRTDELADAAFSANAPDRCYHCKRHLFSELTGLAQKLGLPFVVDGTNVDDGSDYRPGRRAGKEFKVRSPLAEAGLTKADIRALSQEMGLRTWNVPAAACLASRIPYGEAITTGKLRRIEKAESLLRRMGFDHVRVRSHGDLARIEVPPGRVAGLAADGVGSKVAAALHKAGFTYATLDLDGYRTGSMNEALNRR